MRFIAYLMIGTCLMACSQRKVDDDRIVINLNQHVRKSILFSTFVDSITYIPLETNEECLLGKIRDIIISDSIIFVLNGEQNEIFLFNIKGEYLRKISHRGNGSGEYSTINQISYNKKRESLSIAANKIIEYDLNGNLKNEFKAPYYISDLYQFDNGDYLLSRLERLDKPNSVLKLTDNTGKLKKDILKRNPKYNIETTNYWELIKSNDGINFISPQIENTIYSYKNDSLSQELNFKLLPEVSSDYYSSKPRVALLADNYYRTIFRESDNWINLVFCTTSEIRTVLYNKKDKKQIVGEIFKNDIDDKEHLFFLSESGNNTFTNYVKSEIEDNNPLIQILHLK